MNDVEQFNIAQAHFRGDPNRPEGGWKTVRSTFSYGQQLRAVNTAKQSEKVYKDLNAALKVKPFSQKKDEDLNVPIKALLKAYTQGEVTSENFIWLGEVQLRAIKRREFEKIAIAQAHEKALQRADELQGRLEGYTFPISAMHEYLQRARTMYKNYRDGKAVLAATTFEECSLGPNEFIQAATRIVGNLDLFYNTCCPSKEQAKPDYQAAA